jgi:PAS domain S-box-containing protein
VPAATSALVAAAIGLGAVAQAQVGAWLVGRGGFRPTLERVSDVFRLLTLGGLLASVVAATIGTAALWAAGLTGPFGPLVTWLTWWLGDSIGVILFAPFVLVMVGWRSYPARTNLVEFGAWLALTLVVGGVAFSEATALPVLLVPMLVWAAMRFGVRGGVSAILGVAAIGLVPTLLGHGPYARSSLNETLLTYDGFVVSLAVPALALIAALAAHRRAETELQHQASLFEAVIAHIPDMVFLKEARELRFVLLNRMGERMLGRPSAQVVGKNDYDFFPAEQVAFFEAKDRETLRARALVEIPEEPIDTPEGPRWLHTRKVPILGPDGEPAYLLGISEDITELRQAHAEIDKLNAELERRVEELGAANERLRELDHLKSNFVNSVSHELRTPLTSIVGYSEFLEDDVAGALTPEQREFVRQIEAGAARLQRLVDDLLDFARMDAGTFALRLDDADVCARVEETVAAVRPMVTDARLALVVDCEGPQVVRMDAQRVGQVLLNFISNAMKFTPSGGTITVRVRPEAGVVRVQVTDTGPGISPEDQARLFQRFSQLENRKGGTGLGLSISKALIEAHGGEIGVESAVGAGSTFWFTLPRAGVGASA